ncbi:nucleoside monophosphate kinase [Candidatus Pacearchaeota archaeon]|nr:nucleoside monophosphate kinase [Candidatus Pacearchaeota archaeon]
MEKQRYKAILIFGPPGVGKGTQAKLLGGDKRYLHFSTGDMFRGLKDNPRMKGSDLAIRINELIAGGNFVPDNLTIELFYKTLEEYVNQGKYNPQTQTLILDGIPRNPAQVDLISNRIEVIKIISLVVNDDEVLVQRLKSRASIEGRKDDSDEAVVRKRLEIYKKDTAAVLEKYDRSLVLSVNGLPSVEEIHEDILARLSRDN